MTKFTEKEKKQLLNAILYVAKHTTNANETNEEALLLPKTEYVKLLYKVNNL